MWEFKTLVERKFGVQFEDYHGLQRWSVENVGAFWGEVWGFVRILSARGVDDGTGKRVFEKVS